MTAEREREHSEAGPYSEVVLLLGAGASVEAGAPTVTDLVDGFREFLSVEEESLTKTYDELLEVLRDFTPVAEGRAILDVELLLTSLTMLIDLQDNPLSAFAHNWKGFVRRRMRDLPRLVDALQAHIRKECTLNQDRVEYLRPIGDFMRHFGRLDIFTLNYDAAIELTLQKENFSYTDGFDVYWNPVLLSSDRYQVRLFKLHGSLLWFITSTTPHGLVKIPVKTTGGLPEFFSEDEVSHNLIYPVLTKEQHVEPYATLMNHLREALSQARVLIAVGCSFRDTYLKQVVVEKMLQNRDLRLCLVDPEAPFVVEQSDRMLDEQWAFESVSERLSALQLRAGQALSGRLLFSRALALAGLPASRAAHVSAALQSRGPGDTQPYGNRLIEHRILAELCSACEDASTGEALQAELTNSVRQASYDRLGELGPVAIYLLGHCVRREWKKNVAEWLTQATRHAAAHVCYGNRIFLGDGQKVVRADVAETYFPQRREQLAQQAGELAVWLSMPLGVPNDVSAKIQALRASLTAFFDYFDALVRRWPQQIKIFRNMDGDIQVPRPDDDELLKAMGSHFDHAQEPAVLRALLS